MYIYLFNIYIKYKNIIKYKNVYIFVQNAISAITNYFILTRVYCKYTYKSIYLQCLLLL